MTKRLVKAKDLAARHRARERPIRPRPQQAAARPRSRSREPLRFDLSSADDRSRLRALMELRELRRQDEAELAAVVAHLLAPLDLPAPVVRVRSLTDGSLANFGLGDGVEDLPTITLAASVVEGTATFVRPRKNALGHRRFLADLAAHEVAHHIARLRGGGSDHGAAFARAAAALVVAHGGRLPPVSPPLAPGWPVSHRPHDHYAGAVAPGFLLKVRRHTLEREAS